MTTEETIQSIGEAVRAHTVALEHLTDVIRDLTQYAQDLEARITINESVLVAQQKAMKGLSDRILALEQA